MLIKNVGLKQGWLLNNLLKTIFITHWYFVLSVYTCITFVLFPQKDVQTIFRKHYVYADKKLTGVSGLVDYIFSNNHFVIITNRSNLQNDDLTINGYHEMWQKLAILIYHHNFACIQSTHKETCMRDGIDADSQRNHQ